MTPEEMLIQAMGLAPPDVGEDFNPFSMPPLPSPPAPQSAPPMFGPDPMAMMQALQPIRQRPGLPSKKELELIEQYAKDFWQQSTDYIQRKLWLWQLWDALYSDSITITQWKKWRREGRQLSTSLSRKDISELLPDTENEVPSDYVHSPAYLARSFVHAAYPALFEGPQYLSVLAPSRPSGPPDQSQQPSFGLDQRMQRFMEEKLEAGGFHAEVEGCLLQGPVLGTVIGKATWHTETIPVSYMDPLTGQERIEYEVIEQYPCIENIPLERAIVDSQARHPNVQRHRGIGHWVELTYDQVLAGFDGEVPKYNLNRKEFIRLFENAGNNPTNEDEVQRDPDRDQAEDTDTFVRVGEIHIKVPLPRGLTEMVVKLATNAGTDDAGDALLIGVLQGPVLFDYGKRPFRAWQFDRQNGVFGTGIIQSEESIFYLLSQFMGQAQENTKRAAIATMVSDEETKAYLEKRHNGKIPYGGVLPILSVAKDITEKLQPVPLPVFPEQMVDNLIALLKNTAERRSTSVDAPVAGAQKSEQTATGMGILQQQGQAPLRTHLSQFCRSFLNPLLECCLELCRQNLSGAQSVTLQSASGDPVIAEITEEELKGGKFKIVASITAQDAMNNVQAQILRDYVQNVLPVIEPKLLEEGTKPMYAAHARRIYDLLRIQQGDQLLQQFSTYEQQLLAQNQQLQQQMMQMQQAMAQQPPPAPNGNGPGRAPSPNQPGENGGPMGPLPTDQNMALMQLQMAQEPNMGFE